jgi:2'-5' RNA ligase
MDVTVPGKSLDAQFDVLWQRFAQLDYTVDSINQWTNRLRRWLTPVNVSFVIPIDDRTVCDYLGKAQQALLHHMAYEPQPPDKLHITLYQVGYLRQIPLRLPGLWSRQELTRIAQLTAEYLKLFQPIEVLVGPINAFSNVAIAEVRDSGRLRLLRGIISQAIPPLSLPLNYPLIPHITLGYFGTQPAAPIRETIGLLRMLPKIGLTVDRVELTLYYRKPGAYEPNKALIHSETEVIASLPIGQ